MAISAMGSMGTSFPTFGLGASPLNLAAPQQASPTMNPGVAMMFLQVVMSAMTQMQGGWSSFGGQQQGNSGTGAVNGAGNAGNSGTGAGNGTGNAGNAGNAGFDMEAAASNQRAANDAGTSGFP